MTWVNGPFLGFDCESTGVDTETARIVQLAVVRVASPTVVERMSWLINPGVEIPAEATEVHGITNEQVQAEGHDPDDILPLVTTVLLDAWGSGVPVVCYNAPYDLTLLDRELRRHGLLPLGEVGHVIDPLCISNAVAAWKRPHTLEHACEVFHIPWQGQAHDADADAFQACRLAWRLGSSFRALVTAGDRGTDHTHRVRVPMSEEMEPKVMPVGDIPLDVLDRLQARWYRQNAESFVADQRTKGRDPEGVNYSWPIIPKPSLVSA